VLAFPPFRLDLDDERLWQGQKELGLRRKPMAILRYLVANPKRLVTHDELITHVWSGSVVSESAMRTHVHELRQVLGEDLIETVIGRGYRFLAEPVEDQGRAEAAEEPCAPSRPVVGRDAELAALRSAVDRASGGTRQLCFVTGEPGIGKTAAVDAFADALEHGRQALVLRGHCVEQHGTPEPYFAIIDVLSRQVGSRHGEKILGVLLQHAPSFLAQVPHLVPDAHRERVAARGGSGTEARMARELVEALEALGVAQTVVLILEDLQWSDVATLDLIALFGSRRERTRLLVVGTARRAEAQTPSHPLCRVMRGLVARSGAATIALERIMPSAVAEMISIRYPGHSFPPELLAVVDRATEGTPLFVVAYLDELLARGAIGRREGRWILTADLEELAARPAETIVELIALQLDRLSPDEQRVLEAASTVGVEFAAGLLAAALDVPVERADELCDGLARRNLFLRRAGTEEWADGSLQSCYGLIHAVVQHACRVRTSEARRQRWHRLIAERLEVAHAGRLDPVLHLLAHHFAAGQVVDRALRYTVDAAERAARQFATGDAKRLFANAFALVRRMPASRDRDDLELRALLGDAMCVLLTRTDIKQELDTAATRMLELVRRLDDPTRSYSTIVGLAISYASAARYSRAEMLLDELEAMSKNWEVDRGLVGFGAAARALVLFWNGRLAEAADILDQVIGGEIIGDAMIGVFRRNDRTAVMMGYLSNIRWLVGAPDRALVDAKRGVALGETGSDRYSRGHTLSNLAGIHFLRRDPPETVRATAQAVLDIAEGVAWHPQANLLVAWAGSQTTPLGYADAYELVLDLRDRVARYPMSATLLVLPLVDLLRASNHIELAKAVVEEYVDIALAHDERAVFPELVRLRGELLVASDPAAAEAAFLDAILGARAMGARAVELRAATSLARLSVGTDAEPVAFAGLRAALDAMVDGRDSPDQVDARAVLG
jgi:DNA-binding winged helix-turn-helix (wHTH) protein